MENKYMSAENIALEIGISKSSAYKIIRELNCELEKKGYLTIAGKIPRHYFEERYYLDMK